MNRIQVTVRDQSQENCKPLLLSFTIEGDKADISVVLDGVKDKYPGPKYKMEMVQEETIYHVLAPDLRIAHA